MLVDVFGEVMVDRLPENRDDGRVQSAYLMSAFHWSS